MLTFNTGKLAKSSFRGVEFSTLNSSLTSGKRLTTHSYIDSGTRTEENGLTNKTFTIEGYCTGVDYADRKEDLIQALEVKGTGVLVDTFYGTIEVFVQSFTVKESTKSLGRADFSISFIKEVNRLSESVFTNLSRIEEFNTSLEEDFRENYKTNIGKEALVSVSNYIRDEYSKTNDTIQFMESTSDLKQNLQSDINIAIAGVIDEIDNTASIIKSLNIINQSVDAFYLGSSLSSIDFKSSVNNLLNSIKNLTGTNENELDTTEKIQLENNKSFIALKTVTQLQSLNETLENIEFSTGSSFGEVKESTLLIFDALEDYLTSGTSLNNLKDYKVKYIEFITQNFSSLQDLREIDQVATTNIYSLSLNTYINIDRIKEVMTNNQIIDPTFINGKIKVLTQ